MRSNQSSRDAKVNSGKRQHQAGSTRPKVTVTTSWDDGHRLDVRMAELLAEYELPGTFYISPRDVEFEPRDRLSDAELKDFPQGFEIGAHTMTHPRLTTVDEKTAQREIVDSKSYLEDVTGRAVNSFCYPYGLFSPEHVKIVQNTGFRYARTVKRFSRHVGADPLQAPTTVHAYRHLVDIPQVVACGKFSPVGAWTMYAHWDRLAERQFDEVLARGGVFHLWGHSWEVEKHRDWAALRRVFDYISRRSEVAYLANGDLEPETVA